LKITISGASGLIGRRLLKLLAADGHALHVLSRHAGTNMPPNVKVSAWDPAERDPPRDAVAGADAIVHLAGESVAQRWSEDVKHRIRESRVMGTTNLVQGMGIAPQPPKILICASATGYYGSRGDEVLTEASAPGSDYLAEVCVEWEKAAQAAETLGVRVARIRTGVVLDRRGGALGKMLLPFKMGVGGRVGTGRQWMSWIHAGDLASLIRWTITTPVSGPVNAVAPNPVTNAEFTRELASALGRPAIFPVPAFGLKLIFGEMSEVLLGSQRVQPKVAETGGFEFQYPHLNKALREVLK